MWYCSSCGTGNEDSARFCVECGLSRLASIIPETGGQAGQAPPSDTLSGQPSAPLNTMWRNSEPDSDIGRTTVLNQIPHQAPGPGVYPGWTPAPAAPGSYAAPKKRKSLWWLWLLLGLATLATLAAVFFFVVLKWSPATCTEPETSNFFHLTRGEALGHTGSPATCTEPQICTRCGETLAPALGHDWQPATYDAPETCSRCGETRGECKGWVGDLSGSMGDESLFLAGKGESHPFLLDRVIHKCMHLTLYIQLNEVEGDPYGDWGLFARDLDGNWQQIATFTVARTAYQNFVSFDLSPIGLPSFDALSTVPITDGDYTINYTFYYENVQEYVD